MERWMREMLMVLFLLFGLPLGFLLSIILRLPKWITKRTFFGLNGLLLFIGGVIVLIFVSEQEVRSSIAISNYRVDFVEDVGIIEHQRYFEVIQNNKKRSRFVIDGDANKCEDFNVQRQEHKVYFHCSGDYAPDRVSYVDTEQRTLYAGYNQRLIKIDELDFR